MRRRMLLVVLAGLAVVVAVGAVTTGHDSGRWSIAFKTSLLSAVRPCARP
jgi:hypothetical protein